MPSRAAIASATSGIRATSAFTNTMAVITGPHYRAESLTGGPGDRGEVTPLRERHQRPPGLLDGIVDGQVTARAGDRTAPLALDVDEADTGGLQPAQDRLGLLS